MICNIETCIEFVIWSYIAAAVVADFNSLDINNGKTCRELLEKLYLKNSHMFMRRYHKYLAVEDCDCFDQNDYEIQFYAKAIIERCKDTDTKKRKVASFQLCCLSKFRILALIFIGFVFHFKFLNSLFSVIFPEMIVWSLL